MAAFRGGAVGVGEALPRRERGVGAERQHGADHPGGDHGNAADSTHRHPVLHGRRMIPRRRSLRGETMRGIKEERDPLEWPKLPRRSCRCRAAMRCNSGKAMPPDASIRAQQQAAFSTRLHT
jgi:hypothetical protein